MVPVGKRRIKYDTSSIDTLNRPNREEVPLPIWPVYDSRMRVLDPVRPHAREISEPLVLSSKCNECGEVQEIIPVCLQATFRDFEECS